ncbi:histone deacetylase [Streptomyces sp. ODS28]|uniref:histone deacetylase n=1 Tax=Streptomyces sp. ODS28 TaxID=3136688 RepID=UPI0031EBB6DE
MHRVRLDAYLRGGRPPGGARTYPGCRDKREPAGAAPLLLPGALYFAHESSVWTGGMAFYDPDGAGVTAARAYLVTPQQFSDIAEQEAHRVPGRDLDLDEVLKTGRCELGPGCYETLVCPGSLDGVPVLTFTAPWGLDAVRHTRPSAAYLRHIAAGLADSHGWDPARIGAYLTACPGAAGRWEPDEVAALLRGEPTG